MKALLLSSLILLGICFANSEIITSPPTTDWGEWGYIERCPEGTFAQGFQLKTEDYQGQIMDDSALNGIKLYCGNPLNPNTKTVTSAVGNWGNWGNVYACGMGQGGEIIGFQLRVEEPAIIDDETATNNVRFICSDIKDEPINYLEGDGLDFGSWKATLRCSEGLAVCGIQTQIQPNQGVFSDDTAMNRLSVECCPQ